MFAKMLEAESWKLATVASRSLVAGIYCCQGRGGRFAGQKFRRQETHRYGRKTGELQ